MGRPERAPFISVGDRFHRLVVVREVTGRGRREWECKCDCGGIVPRVGKSNLVRGTTGSCGCRQRENASRSSKQLHTRHGQRHTREYAAWHSMKDRCFNKNSNAFKDYGLRGITVTQPWVESFEAFFAEVGRRPSPRHTLGRIDNNGNYEPGNVRWETMSEQARNRRSSRHITCNGVTRLLVEWSQATGLKRNTITRRIDVYGWSVARALTCAPRGTHA